MDLRRANKADERTFGPLVKKMCGLYKWAPMPVMGPHNTVKVIKGPIAAIKP